MSPSFFFRVPEDAAHRVALPAGRARHLIDRCPLRSAQHRNHRILLRWPLRVRMRLRVRQQLNRRPQLIDQRITVADLLPLLDTGQSVPQRQQPLAANPTSPIRALLIHTSTEDALALTFAVHTQGKGIAGTYTFEVAEQKQCEVLLMAKIEEHPLRVEVERV